MPELKHSLEGNNGVVRGAEIQVYRRDGSKKWAMCNLRTVRNAQGKTVLDEGTVEDITDRKAAEERVQFLGPLGQPGLTSGRPPKNACWEPSIIMESLHS